MQLILRIYYLNIFDIHLLTNSVKEKGEYKISDKVKRIIIRDDNLIQIIKKRKLDIIIYQSYNEKNMKLLNELESTKTIFYDHS